MITAWAPTWSSAAQERPLSLEAWFILPEDEPGEFVDGYLTEEEVPDPAHELAVAWLIVLFAGWLKGRGGFVFGSELKLQISAKRGRKADVVVFFPGTKAPPKRGVLTAPPDLLVEVVTPTPRDERRDRVEKMAEYASMGVRFYWLVDPALGAIEIFELTDGSRYTKVLGATGGRVEVPGCAGLELDVDELWSELDRLSSEP